MIPELSEFITPHNFFSEINTSEIPGYLKGLFDKSDYKFIIEHSPKLITSLDKENEHDAQGYVLYYYGLSLFQFGEFENAKKQLCLVLTLSDAGKTTVEPPLIYNHLGIIERNLSNFTESRVWYEKALEYFKDKNDVKGQARVYNNLGMLEVGFGNFSRALFDFSKSLSIRKKNGLTAGMPVVLNNIGLIYLNIGRLSDAMLYFSQALELERNTEDKNGTAICLLNIGSVHENLHNYDEALKYYRESLKLRSETGNINGTAHCLSHIGHLFFIQEKYDDAHLYFIEAKDIKKKVGDKLGEANYLRMIGECLSKQQKYKEAMSLFDTAEKVYRETKNIAELHHLLLCKAGLYSLSGCEYYDPNKAEKLLCDALEFSIGNSDEKMQMNIRKSLADFYETEQRPTEALIHFKKFHVLVEQINGKDVFAKILTLEAERKIEQIQKEHEFTVVKNKELEQLVKERTARLDTLIRKEQNFRSIHEEFVRHVSHEFRTPLTAITLGVSVIEKIVAESEDFAQSAQILAFCHAMNTASQTLRTILDSAQTLIQAQTEVIDVDLVEIDIATIVVDFVSRWKTMASPKQMIDIRVVNSEAHALSNPIIIEKIIELLLDNAKMYSPDYATVTITIACDKKNCIVSVHNTDSFIPPQDKEQIFDVFYRGSQYRELRHGGLGIGLTICTMYALSISASIECNSDSEMGTEFILSMPVFKLANP